MQYDSSVMLHYSSSIGGVCLLNRIAQYSPGNRVIKGQSTGGVFSQPLCRAHPPIELAAPFSIQYPSIQAEEIKKNLAHLKTGCTSDMAVSKAEGIY